MIWINSPDGKEVIQTPRVIQYIENGIGGGRDKQQAKKACPGCY